MTRLRTIIISAVLVLCVVFSAYAATVDLTGQPDKERFKYTLHSAVSVADIAVGTVTGISDTLILPKPMHRFTWSVGLSSAPATGAVTSYLYGALNAETPGTIIWDRLDTNTSVATGSIRHIVNKPVRYLKAEVLSTDGTAGRTITVEVLGMKD
jgi:hypothetical protein